MNTSFRLAVVLVFGFAGCAGTPRTAPFPGGPVQTGPGTVESARKFLEGRWSLISFEVFPPGQPGIQVSGDGSLVYDAFGNLDIQIRVPDEDTSQKLSRAGIPLAGGLISTSGRTAIDLQARTLTYFLDGAAPLLKTGPASPLALSRPRHWEVEGDLLTLTTRGDDGKPASVARWQKMS
jgi:hypothetical protein